MDSNEQRDLRSLREEIARLTLEIIKLSGKRLALARKIGEIKARIGMPIEDPTAENDLRMRVIDFSRKNGINEDFSLKLLELLIEESKRVQQETLEAYEGH